MVLTSCIRRLKTVQRLGFANSMRLIKQRHKQSRFNATWRKKDTIRTKCASKTAANAYAASSNKLHAMIGHSWHDIAQQQGCTPSFEQFFNQQRVRTLPVLERLLGTIGDDEYTRRADEYVRKELSILGSEKRMFQEMPWHEDIRLTGQDSSAYGQFDATSWYADIGIATSTTDQLGKDIKVAWELSRLQHMVVLGRAYTATYQEIYAQAFVEHMHSWWASNPFLHGINWVCPMEVAMRAINMVIAFTSFSRSPVIEDEFWLSYVTSLYDHMIYLENNWELYDLRTSNHYLADLVGYLYLCWFFNDCPNMHSRVAWCHQELLVELGKQINPDGTSYEQTTQYHRLVTELYYHHRLVAQQLRLPMPLWAEQKFSAMVAYLQWCTPSGGKLITIGDHDSGVVTVAGLPDAIIADIDKNNLEQQPAVRHFQHAGLSIIKTPSWHVSLRHNVHHEQEPTSHLHNDATSVTLACHGIPLIVDPGSYVYTPSSVWRNLFRSAQAHSGLYLAHATQHIESIALDDNIFLLGRKPAPMPEQKPMLNADQLHMRTTHTDYAAYGYTPERHVTLDEQAATVMFNDQWHAHAANPQQDSNKQGQQEPLYACFQFILHPDVTVQKAHVQRGSTSGSAWLLSSHGVTLELASDQLVYELQPAWYSPAYGVKIATHKLVARYELSGSSQRFGTIMRFAA